MTDRGRFRGQDPDNEFGQEDYAGQDDTSSSMGHDETSSSTGYDESSSGLGYDESMGYDEAAGYDEAVGYDATQDQGGRIPGAESENRSERGRYQGQDTNSSRQEDEYGAREEEFGSDGAW